MRLNVGIIFGGKSLAHELSIITAMEIMDSFDAEKYNDIIKPKLEEWLSRYTVQELEDGLAEKIPLSGIKNIQQVVEDPQIKAREILVTERYPEKDILSVGQVMKLSETPGDPIGMTA